MTAACTVCELHAESTFKIEGMDCREEVAILERRFKNLSGIEDFTADVMGQRLHVKYDAAVLTTGRIAEAVADTGMRAWLEHEEPIGEAPRGERQRRWLLGASAAALGVALVLEAVGLHRFVTALYGGAIVAGLVVIGPRIWRAIRTRSLDINLLMAIAVAGAISLQQYAEAAAVIVLFAIAQMLEVRTLEHARRAISALLDLTPAEALVRDADGERRVHVDSVAIGTTIVIRPGEKIPLDGVVTAGESAVNQAPVTGESLPADKAPGDEVFAGTINGRGALDVRVTRARGDTTLARITYLVERAQAQRAPAQTVVERFARVYTPSMIALAIIVAIAPPLLLGGAWSAWIYRALVLLVVSCPCALVISTPVSIVAALTSAARKGVLIKGGVHLERTGAVRCVAFDKTGTLTRGLPEIVEVVPLNGVSASDVIALAAAIEHRSDHPIAHAIVRHAVDASIVALPGDGVTSIDGRGAQGRVGGRRVVVGNHRLFEERQLCSPNVHQRLDAFNASCRMVVLVARDDELVGMIAVADRPREHGRAAVALLREQGLESIVMLTGDSHGTAKAIAEELGIEEFRAELLPEDKLTAVSELKRRYGTVAMVGDGVNDAPALASADVGIAMGAAGSDAALETADVALMADELLKIPYAFRLSRATVRNIKMNLAISVLMKAAFIVAAIAGVATLWMAILADTGASVIVIANALRLLRAD
jgi:Zn2+/Cd2+-exporting ATPase